MIEQVFKMFVPNKKFKKDYDQTYKKDPVAANLFLLMCELVDKSGNVYTDEKELATLFNARFNDPEEYSL